MPGLVATPHPAINVLPSGLWPYLIAGGTEAVRAAMQQAGGLSDVPEDQLRLATMEPADLARKGLSEPGLTL